MIVRPLIGLAVALEFGWLHRCVGVGRVGTGRDLFATGSLGRSGSLHRAGCERRRSRPENRHRIAAPGCHTGARRIELRPVPGRNQAGVRRVHRRVQPGDGRVSQRHLGPPGHPSLVAMPRILAGHRPATAWCTNAARRSWSPTSRAGIPSASPVATDCSNNRPSWRTGVVFCSPESRRNTPTCGRRRRGVDEAPCSSPRRRGAYLHRWEERSRFIAFKERSNPPPGGPISAASLWSTSMAAHLGR